MWRCQKSAQAQPKTIPSHRRPQPVQSPELLRALQQLRMRQDLGPYRGSLTVWMERTFIMVGVIKHQYNGRVSKSLGKVGSDDREGFFLLKAGLLSKSPGGGGGHCSGNQGIGLGRGVAWAAPLKPHGSSLCRRTTLGWPERMWGTHVGVKCTRSSDRF